ncbi:hypothetical protein Q7P37_005606 [Cladosporium fusiforme]
MSTTETHASISDWSSWCKCYHVVFAAWSALQLWARHLILEDKSVPTHRRATPSTDNSKLNMPHQIKIEDAFRDSAHVYRAFFEGWEDDDHRVRLRFGRVINGLPKYSSPIYQDKVENALELKVLSKVRDLQITIITGNHPSSICAIQDMFFAFVQRIPEKHALRSLKVTITIIQPNDATSRDFVTADVQPCKDGRENIHEYKATRPRNLSRAHMIAFLIDPLRTLRNVNGGRKGRDMLLMDFKGAKGKIVGENLRSKVEDLVRGDEDVKDYEVFRGYHAAMCDFVGSVRGFIEKTDTRDDPVDLTDQMEGPAASGTSDRNAIIDLTDETEGPTASTIPNRNATIDLTDETEEPHTPASPASSATIDLATDDEDGKGKDEMTATKTTPTLTDLDSMQQALAEARIRGDFEDLSQLHEDILTLSNSLLDPDRMVLSNDDARDRMHSFLEQRSEASKAFPKNCDVSFYGYAETDATLIARKQKSGDEDEADGEEEDPDSREEQAPGKGKAKAPSKRKRQDEERDDFESDFEPTRKKERVWTRGL